MCLFLYFSSWFFKYIWTSMLSCSIVGFRYFQILYIDVYIYLKFGKFSLYSRFFMNLLLQLNWFHWVKRSEEPQNSCAHVPLEKPQDTRKSDLMFNLCVILHGVKSARISNFSGSYFPVFGLNTENVGKYGAEKLLIRTLLRQCYLCVFW